MLPDDEGIFDNKVLHIIHDIIRDGSLRQNNHYPCFYKVLSRSLRENKHYLSVAIKFYYDLFGFINHGSLRF
jgi:hypothetical protein